VHETSEEGRRRGWEVRRGGPRWDGPGAGRRCWWSCPALGPATAAWTQRRTPGREATTARPGVLPNRFVSPRPTALDTAQATGKQLHAPASRMRCAKCVV